MKIKHIIATASLSVFSAASFAVQAAPVPVSEPGTFALLGLSLALLALVRRNK